MNEAESWRLIDSGPCGAAYNMALDEAIATEVRLGASPPTLRFFGWELPSVSIGCFQPLSEVDIGFCDAKGVPVVRRPTGGRSILHADELTYSFSARTGDGPFSAGLLDSYGKIGSALNLAFRNCGVLTDAKDRREKGRVLAGSPLCFRSSSLGEILLDGRKLVGSAQKRWEDGLLQQGSIPFEHNESLMSGVFGSDRTEGFRLSVADVKEAAPALTKEALKEAIRDSFRQTFGISLAPAAPSPREVALALRLEKEKYLQPAWTSRK